MFAEEPEEGLHDLVLGEWKHAGSPPADFPLSYFSVSKLVYMHVPETDIYKGIIVTLKPTGVRGFRSVSL